MQVRIEDLFLITHQRDMGRTKAIGLSFARGLLAEKKGLPVNWAEFATKQTNRRKKSDTSIVPRALKSRAGHEFHKYWVFDEESKTLKFDYEGAVDDWNLNSTRVTRSALAESGNSVYSSLLQNYTAEVIGRPLHKRGLMWQDSEIGTHQKQGQCSGAAGLNSEVMEGGNPKQTDTTVPVHGGLGHQGSSSEPTWEDKGHELLLSPYEDEVGATNTVNSLTIDCPRGGWKRKIKYSHGIGRRLRREVEGVLY
ncbi:hypothetical protein KC19_4G029900 [Ceratodon purpureus]|uniref:Uncharacterized protein n=1 Tax=Ceratodon purpureus TaxID=3225 RepID=A0A8T0I613_CERPU|nr:hypothetical protein KC19_4G029900 [Ceratodon purpureus]